MSMLAVALCASALSFSPHPLPASCLVGGRCVRVAMSTPSPPPERSAQELLDAANEKLEKLNEVDQAPKSWADLGLPPKPPQEPAIPAALSILPPVLGGTSVLMLLLNKYGVFGEGPDLDALAESLSQYS